MAAAVALAAAKATANGILGLDGEGSHLDLFLGLPVSPFSSSVACLILLGAWLAWLESGMGEVLVSVLSAAVTGAATATPSVARIAAPPSLVVPERLNVHIWVFRVSFEGLGFIVLVP